MNFRKYIKYIHRNYLSNLIQTVATKPRKMGSNNLASIELFYATRFK